MLENTEWAIKKGQSRETGNIGYTRRRQTKHNATQSSFVTNIIMIMIIVIIIIL